ncbi:lytic transglycosylase domain-containing protein [Paracoccus sp. SCSIO 75233]|uniref:lytic transglycosylase domain-containing protein n=1 Tax=Paracoccus sp. SCSIO 75233 TaxID=3017782 RepID=UPI0022F1133E|nr:lytic transglycosylase domain-containing protein [Paracoccus sp. SCSIO 75233]WBU52725.1 lytic transglycosylase domain-containing protein [Paracoccus sp. SCSIO 75233]
MMYPFRDMIRAGLFALAMPLMVQAESVSDMSTALTAAGSGNWLAAEAAAAQSGPLAEALVQWHELRAGRGSFADYLGFARDHADWPGMELLYNRGEAVIPDGAAATDVIAWFSTHSPRTGRGATALVAALRVEDADAAKAEARRIWTTLPMTEADETAFLAAHGDLVDDLHDVRVFALLDQFEWQAAEQNLARMTDAARPLAEARIATQARRSGVDDLILSLPADQQADPGLAMDRFRWRVDSRLNDLARDLMSQQSTSAEALRRPEIWASMRADYARASLRAGDWQAAEDIAAPHFLEPGTDAYAEMEFLAGYAALRGGAADRALQHFENLGEKTTSVISQSRAYYWQGRAQEAAGNAEAAQAAFERAATMQSAYYGQLAAERIGAPTDPALSVPGRAEAALPQWRRTDLRENEVFQAGVYAFAAGHPDLGQRFFLQLSETAAPDDIARMARLTLEMRYPWYALRLAKRAASRGVAYPAAYYPLTGLEAEPLDLPPELVMAISRQESEFNHTVSSHVGAQGLMQLMPATAQMMAERVGVEYDRARLTEDPYYNAMLGAAYLSGLRDSFGPSSALVAAGYNAGPGRSRQWTERFGDIRNGADPVDWVEMIPFDETRNYVMRVTEALPIYRSRIAGQPVPLTPTQDLTGGGIIPPPPKARQTLAEVLTQSRRPPQEGDAMSPEAAAFEEPETPPPPAAIRPVPRPTSG